MILNVESYKNNHLNKPESTSYYHQTNLLSPSQKWKLMKERLALIHDVYKYHVQVANPIWTVSTFIVLTLALIACTDNLQLDALI